jgi:hypothetical protein
MPELKTLPTGEAVLRDEDGAKAWLCRKGWYFIDREMPSSYPCLANVEIDCRGDDCPVYRYLSDAEAMVSALEESGAK